MKAVRFDRYGPPSVLSVIDLDMPIPGPGEVLIRVEASAINPSDVMNVTGVFGTALPRTPGRDYAGTVIAGAAPAGQGVWGSGPNFGIALDGAHAEYVLVRADWLSIKPGCLTMAQAATAGVPFITAWSALVTEGDIQPGETILIIGAAGAVGRAAAQIAHWRGAKVIPAIRAKGPVEAGMIDTLTQDITQAVRHLTEGRGVELVLDCVGGPFFEPALTSLRIGGRHMVIVSKGQRRVSFDLADFYHNRAHLIGVDSLKLAGPEIASIMNQLAHGFEAEVLKPSEVRTWKLADVAAAYEAAARGGSAVRQVILPHG